MLHEKNIRKRYPCFKRCHYTYIIKVFNENFYRSLKLVYFYSFSMRKGQKIISDTSRSHNHKKTVTFSLSPVREVILKLGFYKRFVDFQCSACTLLLALPAVIPTSLSAVGSSNFLLFLLFFQPRPSRPSFLFHSIIHLAKLVFNTLTYLPAIRLIMQFEISNFNYLKEIIFI